MTLTDDDKKIARAFGMTPEELSREKQALAAQPNRFAIAAAGGWAGVSRGARSVESGLTKVEDSIVAAFNIDPRRYAADKTLLASGNFTALCTVQYGRRTAKERRPERAGLLEAHLELDAAHKSHYEDSQAHPAGADGAPDQELLDTAMRELKAFSLSKEEATYDRLVNGFLYVAKLVNRLAPAYADRKE